jgi:hypothetical protein
MRRDAFPPPLPDHRCVTYLYLPFPREEVRPAGEYLAIAQEYLDEHFLWFAACANGAGREQYPEDFELQLQACVIYQRYFHWDEARRCLEALVESLRSPSPRTPEQELRYCRARLALAQLYDKLGDPDHCLRVLREILTGNPGFRPAREELARICRLV